MSTLDDATTLDRDDPVPCLRDRFHIPRTADGDEVLYMCGNSLGLQPRDAATYVDELMQDWATLGVDGHFDSGTPWYSYHEVFRDVGARLVGAVPGEVVMMNSLTVNLHLLLTSFYRPVGDRTKLLMETPAFPSDIYCVKSHLQSRGLDPATHLIEVGPRPGEHTVRDEDVIAAIEEAGDTLATIMIGGVNFLTGQVFDMQAITQVGHRVGAMVGFDLAHAAGNCQLHLHDWDVDFAAWCSYKYLNSGPGAIAGVFVHERHGADPNRVRLAGWWGNDPATRFRMHLEDAFTPVASAESWQISNPSILSMAPLRASLALFDEVGMESIHAKSMRMTRYVRSQLESVPDAPWTIITPTESHGAQLSIIVDGDACDAFDRMSACGVVADFRPPNVIRVAPVPLYNTYVDCLRLATIMTDVFMGSKT